MGRRFFSGGVFAALCGIATLAFAAGVVEFRDASNLSGCGAIPYQLTAIECRNYQTEVTTACKGQLFGSERKDMEKLIRKINDKLRNLEEAKSRNNRVVIPDIEADIDKFRKEVNVIKAKAFKGIQDSNACLFARQRVQRVFKDATTSVEAAGNADPELAPYAIILVAKYKLGIPGHAQAITDAQNARDNWTWVKNEPVP